MYYFHVSDLEGKTGKLLNAIDAFNSEYHTDMALLTDSDGNEYLDLPEDVCFISGGDSIDKGPNDQQLLSILINTKEKFPERCHLIAGNRDINKMRWVVEVNDTHINELFQQELNLPTKERLLSGGDRPRTLTWVDKGKLCFVNYLAEAFSVTNDEALRDKFSQLTSMEKHIFYVKWMLSQTMGAPDAWEFRRQELAVLNDTSIDDVTDEQVYQGFMALYGPEGLISAYLQNAKIIDNINGIVCSHGGVRDSSFTFTIDGERVVFKDLSDLIDTVNQVYGQRISAFYQGKYAPDTLYHELQDLGIGVRNQGHSVTAVNIRNESDVISVPISANITALGETSIFIFGHKVNGEYPGLATKYWRDGVNNKIRAIQMYVNDTEVAGRDKETAFVVVHQDNAGNFTVRRFAQRTDGDITCKLMSPTISPSGHLADKQLTIDSPELLVGAAIPMVPAEKVPDSDIKNTGWVVDSYNASAQTFNVRRVEGRHDALITGVPYEALKNWLNGLEVIKQAFNLSSDESAQDAYRKCYVLLAFRHGNDREKTLAELNALIQFRLDHPVSNIVELSDAEQAENVRSLLQFVQSCQVAPSKTLITSAKALKKDASKFFLLMALAMNGVNVSMAQIERTLDPRKKEIEGQAEQPVGVEGALECAKTRVQVSVDEVHDYGITIESFMRDFTEGDLEAVDATTLDLAVIGLGAKSSSDATIGRDDIHCIRTASIALPGTFMQKAIQTAESQGKEKLKTGYAVTAGSEFEKEIKGSNGAAWQLLVTMKYDEKTGEVSGLSRRGQMIRAFLDSMAHMTQAQVDSLKCTPSEIAEKAMSTLNQLGIRPSEMNCSSEQPLSLGYFGSLQKDDKTGLFSVPEPQHQLLQQMRMGG